MKKIIIPVLSIIFFSVSMVLYSCGGGSSENSSGNQNPDSGVTNNINVETDCIFIGAFESILGFIELSDLTSSSAEELDANVNLVGVLEDTFDIEAIVYDFVNTGSFADPGRLFAADEDILLEINTSSPNSVFVGVFGTVVLPGPIVKNINSVDGLAYDPNNDIYYGSNRELGLDYTFSFNLIEDGNDTLIDNVGLLSVMPGNISCGSGLCNDIDDLAYDTINEKLLAVINRNGVSNNILVEIDTDTGDFEEIGTIFFDGCSTPLQDIEGLGVTLNGRMFVTTGVEGNSRNDFFEIEIDNTFVPQRVCATRILELENSDTEGLDCSIDASL